MRSHYFAIAAYLSWPRCRLSFHFVPWFLFYRRIYGVRNYERSDAVEYFIRDGRFWFFLYTYLKRIFASWMRLKIDAFEFERGVIANSHTRTRLKSQNRSAIHAPFFPFLACLHLIVFFSCSSLASCASVFNRKTGAQFRPFVKLLMLARVWLDTTKKNHCKWIEMKRSTQVDNIQNLYTLVARQQFFKLIFTHEIKPRKSGSKSAIFNSFAMDFEPKTKCRRRRVPREV